ncbi:Peroxidasin-like protein like [Argiope bruennichi]|uniref:Peroxidasin-like protein like n=1 Tax=Argiope bruennichi TaxID=94029 RepID=A0A8T0FS38_ARGBR|nr:Peroxidasin-like protein like [Argiope bruennichi]
MHLVKKISLLRISTLFSLQLIIVLGENSLQIPAVFFPTNSVIGKRASVTCTPTVVPPSWIHIPNDIDALSGDAIILNCLGSGTPTNNFHGQKHQVHLLGVLYHLIQMLVVEILFHYTCKGTGRPDPFISWSKIQGENIASLSTANQVCSNGTLHIESIAKEDEGMYQCNGLILKNPPFSFPPDSAIGNRVSVTCTPLKGEKMEFKWVRNGQELAIPAFFYPYPSDTDASSGDSLMLHCKGAGRPEPIVSWSKTPSTSGYSDLFQ